MFTRDRHDIRTRLLDAAVLAPSMDNTQPWRFEVGSRTVRVYRDLERCGRRRRTHARLCF